MSEERKRILEMLSQGKTSVDEAERLLTVVDDSATQPDSERLSDSNKEHDHEDEFSFATGIGDKIKAGMAEAVRIEVLNWDDGLRIETPLANEGGKPTCRSRFPKRPTWTSNRVTD